MCLIRLGHWVAPSGGIDFAGEPDYSSGQRGVVAPVRPSPSIPPSLTGPAPLQPSAPRCESIYGAAGHSSSVPQPREGATCESRHEAPYSGRCGVTVYEACRHEENQERKPRTKGSPLDVNAG